MELARGQGGSSAELFTAADGPFVSGMRDELLLFRRHSWAQVPQLRKPWFLGSSREVEVRGREDGRESCSLELDGLDDNGSRISCQG